MELVRYIQTDCYTDDVNDEIYYDEEEQTEELDDSDARMAMAKIFRDYYFEDLKGLTDEQNKKLSDGVAWIIDDIEYEGFIDICKFFEEKLTDYLHADAIRF